MDNATQPTFYHPPQNAFQPSRRRFLKGLLGGMAATTVLPSIGLKGSERLSRELGKSLASLPAGTEGDERFWQLVKDQFPLKRGSIPMNAANLCPSPYPVIETLFRLSRDVDSDVSFQNRGKFRNLQEQTLEALASYLGANSEELVVTRNTSESNNIVINGLNLRAGDEVVIWDQNHPTNNVAWDVRAQRYGFTVKRVTTPRSPKTAEELIELIAKALTRNTKVLAFSHISNISGVALPATKLCQIAKDQGVLTLIDGAQSFGALQVNLHEIGCDFYTGSAHKWLVGPREAGVLYVRKERAADLWPSVVGVGWESARDKGARRFGTLGQRDDANIAAVRNAVEFHQNIGPERVEARVRELASALINQLQKQIPSARFHTPIAPELRAGVVIFSAPGMDPRKTFQTLYEKYQVASAGRTGDFPGIRLCPHIYNTMADVERVVAAIARLT